MTIAAVRIIARDEADSRDKPVVRIGRIAMFDTEASWRQKRADHTQK